MSKSRERKRLDKYDYKVIKKHRNYITVEHNGIKTTIPISEYQKLKRCEKIEPKQIGLFNN